MFEWRWGQTRCRFSLLFPALLTALLIVQPDGLAVSCVAASVMHECGHLLMMLCLRLAPAACTLGAFGMRIELARDRLPGYGRSVAVSLAGPAVNILVAGIFMACGFRRTALVHGVLAVFNLLPAAALDGGQILLALFCMAGQESNAERWLRVLSALVLLPLAVFAFYLFLSGYGNPTLMIVCGYLILLIFFKGND